MAEVDPLAIERDAKIPEHVLDGLKELGALAGVWHASIPTLLSAHQSIGVAQPEGFADPADV